MERRLQIFTQLLGPSLLPFHPVETIFDDFTRKVFQPITAALFPKASSSQNGGPPSTRKKFMGESEMLFVQTNGIAGELVVRTVFQSNKLIED